MGQTTVPQITVKEPDGPEVGSPRNQVLMAYLKDKSSVMAPTKPIKENLSPQNEVPYACTMNRHCTQSDDCAAPAREDRGARLLKRLLDLEWSRSVGEEYDTFSVSTEWDSRRSVTFQEERDGNCCFRRRCFCITGVVLLTLGAISAFITLGVIYGIPGNENLLTRECKASSGQAGFLCDDRTSCIVASALCDGKVDCQHGEDESSRYCGDVPNTLPEGLVFKCANQRSWTYIDKLCDNKNDCGDCSDETALRCPPCPGWRCNTVFFTDCDCIPNTRCNDSIQDCIDWTDETSCL